MMRFPGVRPAAVRIFHILSFWGADVKPPFMAARRLFGRKMCLIHFAPEQIR